MALPVIDAATPEQAGSDHIQLRAACPPVLRIEEAAAVTTLSKRTICELIATGKLPSKKIGRRRIVLRSALETVFGITLA